LTPLSVEQMVITLWHLFKLNLYYFLGKVLEHAIVLLINQLNCGTCV